MLATVIMILHSIRRMLKKAGRGMLVVAQSFDEAITQTDAARRKYPFAE